MSGYKLKLNGITNLPYVNRVEVIDDKGRSYVNISASPTEIALQDNGQTLKIFTNDVNNLQENKNVVINLLELADDLAEKELINIISKEINTTDTEIIEEYMYKLEDGVLVLREPIQDTYNDLYDYWFNYLLQFKL